MKHSVLFVNYLLEFCKLNFNSRLVHVGEFRDSITVTRHDRRLCLKLNTQPLSFVNFFFKMPTRNFILSALLLTYKKKKLKLNT